MPLAGAGCKLRWGEAVEARVRALGVVVDPPGFDDLTRMLEAGEKCSLRRLLWLRPLMA